ncbi:YcxB family protein [Roseivirga sp. UBA1976]|uniref:YcxB family protein n=1 Tax=Roseivirga sp. UBA1976 TaxID=1947386 RepID=UPI00257FAD1B|nr:YcxB family protein [Roseivirga sp. UBA1976]|tara:strand:- start:17447 stop:17923 length:477 start_codon:yes stop_codon:yes gene_type:complete
MIVKTKKYALDKKAYMRAGLKNVFKDQWWVILIALAISAMTFVVPSNWWWIGALIALTLYVLFWVIQFAGVTQLEQSKMLFEKLSYEIDSRQILIKLNSKQGMPMKWEQIKRAWIDKNQIVLVVNKAQLMLFPLNVFKTQNEIKFIETILKRKGLIKE